MKVQLRNVCISLEKTCVLVLFILRASNKTQFPLLFCGVERSRRMRSRIWHTSVVLGLLRHVTGGTLTCFSKCLKTLDVKSLLQLRFCR